MDRRFKIGIVSDHEMSNHVKDAGDKLKEQLPNGTRILSQKENFDSASILLKLYNKEWDIIPLGADLEKFVIELGEVKEKVEIAYNH